MSGGAMGEPMAEALVKICRKCEQTCCEEELQ